mgnify:CR=1 FL=1
MNHNLEFSGSIILFLLGIQIFNTLTGNIFLILGIIPRKWYGLPGIIFSPFLHGGFTHLLFNSVPMFILMNVLLMQGYISFFLVSSQIAVMGGVATWLLGRNAIHVGASGLVLGYMGYFIVFWYFDQSAVNTAILIVLLYYIGGILMGLMPDDPSVSWEGHVYGFIAGGISAIFNIFPAYYPKLLSKFLDMPGIILYRLVFHQG